MENKDKNILAAIAMALYEYEGNNVHDPEPGVITIKTKEHAVECQVPHHDTKTIKQNERIQIYNRR